MLKSQNGITLVALVVTIIILVILATISISLAVNSGLIGKAETARNIYANAEDNYNAFEQIAINVIDKYMPASK
mgnify:CR=1 FL=1